MSSGNSEAEESGFAWKNCTKNPGHPRFIPAPAFSLTDLPEQYRKRWVWDCLEYVMAMTVKLKVGYVSKSRADGYCFSKFRGTSVAHLGSGLVSTFHRGKGPCLCPDCEHGTTPSYTWYEIRVRTARHVVYNSEEARATQVTLFYDEEESCTNGNSKTIWGVKTQEIHDGGDFCFLTCATHDRQVVELLEVVEAPLQYAFAKFQGNPILRRKLNTSSKKLCIIVSHPHGQPKKVTVGWERSREKADTRRPQFHYIYDTDTCRGSSGAFVFQIDTDLSVYLPPSLVWGAIHTTGGLEGGLNKSGISSPDFD